MKEDSYDEMPEEMPEYGIRELLQRIREKIYWKLWDNENIPTTLAP